MNTLNKEILSEKLNQKIKSKFNCVYNTDGVSRSRFYPLDQELRDVKVCDETLKDLERVLDRVSDMFVKTLEQEGHTSFSNIRCRLLLQTEIDGCN